MLCVLCMRPCRVQVMSGSSRWVKKKQSEGLQANNERSKWYVMMSAQQQPRNF